MSGVSVSNGAILVGAGIFLGVVDFLIGRHLASLTPDKAAKMKNKGGKAIDLDRMHRAGKFLMWNAPIVFLLFVGLGLSGIADR